MALLIRPSAQCLRPTTTSYRSTLLASTRSSFHINARPSPHLQRVPAQLSRPSITQPHCSRLLTPLTLQIQRQSSSTPAASNAAQLPDDILTWDRFFALRRRRRYVNLASSLVTGIGACVVFGPMLAAQDIDGWAAQVSGLDPFMVLGVCTLAVGAGGWLCGPTFGNSLFKIWAGRKGWNGPIAEKEKSFFARIKRYRADPSSSSPQNPIPDYYGEKISSVQDYRRWLKDQRAFNLKKNKNML